MSRSNRRRVPRILVSLLALLLTVAVLAGWPSFGAQPTSATVVPLITSLFVTIRPIVTFVLSDSLLIVNIPDAKLNAALHTATGVLPAKPIHRGDLYVLTDDLDLSNLGIQDLEGIQFCKKITSLQLVGNPVTHFPILSTMINLQDLELSSCGLKEVPPEIQGLPKLYYLFMRNNAITTLPDFLKTMPELTGIFVDHNQISKIPTGFGTSGLWTLTISFNRVSEIPADLVTSGVFENLNIMGNRLTSLPAGFGSKAWGVMYLEFNFLDVSDGSPDGTTLAGTVGGPIGYKRQLTPIRNLAAESTPTSIHLAWDPCPDTVEATWSTKVTGYLLYLVEGSTLTPIATLDKDVSEYLDEGLAPLTDRTYYLGVTYDVVDTAAAISGTTRGYVTFDASTPPEPTATPEPMATATAAPTAAPTGSATPTPGGGSSGIPGWLIIAGIGIVVLGLAVVAVVVLEVVKLAKPKTPPPPTPPTPPPPPAIPAA